MAGADGFIRIYRLRDAGRRLELMHRTPVGETPGALTAFKGRLLAGCGNILRIYELGKKKLLRKCEHRKLPTHIATLSTLGDRIFVGDGQVPPAPPLCASQAQCCKARGRLFCDDSRNAVDGTRARAEAARPAR